MQDSFVRAAELWLPSADGHLLEHAGGLYAAAPYFGQHSRTLCFGRAEGLPGRAWDEGRPIVLQSFEGTGFRRTNEAHAAGLRCAVALPTFRDSELTSVAVLLCGAVESAQGALELWHHDPRLTPDLRLADGLFGAEAQALAELSSDAYLPRGSGLPGLAWQRESAVFMDCLPGDHRFLRAQTAAAAGIVRGLALPCAARGRDTWVLSLLSADTPLVGRVESWLVDDLLSPPRFERAAGFCRQAGVLSAAAPLAGDAVLRAATQGAIGRAQAKVRAVVTANIAAGDDPCTAEASAAGWRGVLALPVLGEAGVTEVVALYL